ncbi:unnamed protein product [Discosporangium mesarthrocarpum]
MDIKIEFLSHCKYLSIFLSAVVYSWGRGEDGQLGLGDTNDQNHPVLVDALKSTGVVQVACGSGHTVVLSVDGEVYTWGRGDDGRLGHGDNGWKYVPRLVEGLRGKRIVQVGHATASVSLNFFLPIRSCEKKWGTLE